MQMQAKKILTSTDRYRERKNKGNQQIQLWLADEQWAKIDEWRRKQPDLPVRTEALRRLLELGMKKG